MAYPSVHEDQKLIYGWLYVHVPSSNACFQYNYKIILRVRDCAGTRHKVIITTTSWPQFRSATDVCLLSTTMSLGEGKSSMLVPNSLTKSYVADAKFPGQGTGLPPTPCPENPGRVFPKSDPKGPNYSDTVEPNFVYH